MADASKTYNIERDADGRVSKIGNTPIDKEKFEYLNKEISDFGEILKKGYLTSQEYSEVLQKLVDHLNRWSDSLEGLVGQVNNLLNDITNGARTRALARSSVKKFTGVLENLSTTIHSGEILTEKKYLAARTKLTSAVDQATQTINAVRAKMSGKSLNKALKKGEITEQDAAAYRQANLVKENAGKAQKALNREYQASKEAQRNSGTVGINAVGGILGKLGLGNASGAIAEYTRKVQEAYKTGGETRKEKQAAARQARIDNRGELLLDLRKMAAAGLWAKIVVAFHEVDKASVDIRHQIGGWQTSLAGAHYGVATTAETLKMMSELVNQIGLNSAAIFSGEELGRMAEAQKLLGLSAQEAGSMGVYAKLNNQSSEEYTKNVISGVNAGIRANRTAVAHGKALQEALKASDAIKVSMGMSGERIGKAAQAAMALGMGLSDVENISRNLMQFESSIESEMQAQLLTGHSLNLAKARELALNNDLEGVAKEIGKQGVTLYEFGRMNYIQQEGLAKSLGMSREQMSKMLVTQELANGASEKAVAAASGMSVEQLKAMTAADSLKASITRIVEIAAPFLQLLTKVMMPIAKVIGGIVGLLNKGLDTITGKIVAWVLLGAVALTKVVGLLAGANIHLGNMLLKVTRLGRLKDKFTGSGFGTKVRNFFGASKPEANASVGEGTANKVNGLGKINAKNLLTGAAAMAIMAGALWILAKACQEFEKVTWESLGMAGAALIGLAVAMRIVGKAMAGGIPEILIGVGVLALLGLVTGLLVDPIARLVTALNNGDGVMDKLLGLALGLVALGPAMLVFAATGGVGLGMLDQVAGAFTRLSEAFTSLSKANFTAIAAGFRTVAESVKSLSSAVSELSVGKLLVATGIGRITGVRGIEETGIQENASAVRVNTATVEGGVSASTNLAEIERKLDMINQTIIKSRPDWNWLEFNKEQQLNNTHGLAYRG